jgi:hypothetical protein
VREPEPVVDKTVLEVIVADAESVRDPLPEDEKPVGPGLLIAAPVSMNVLFE